MIMAIILTIPLLSRRKPVLQIIVDHISRRPEMKSRCTRCVSVDAIEAYATSYGYYIKKDKMHMLDLISTCLQHVERNMCMLSISKGCFQFLFCSVFIYRLPVCYNRNCLLTQSRSRPPTSSSKEILPFNGKKPKVGPGHMGGLSC